mgnify:CR=1 FL=1
MREQKIKETCSCGAILECSETREESWEHSEVERRQDAFHKAHKNCTKVEVTGVPVSPLEKYLNP